MTRNTATDAASGTTAKIVSEPAFSPQSMPPGTQALVDVGFDINNFHLVYSLAVYTTPEYQSKSLHSADYHLVPRKQPGNPGFDALSPFNTPKTPFLIPSAAKMFGGQLQVFSHSSIPVYWTVHSQFMTQGNVALTQSPTGANYFDTAPTDHPVDPASVSQTGYLPVLATHQWSFQPNDLPLEQPVHLQHKLHLFSDAAFANALTDTTPADDVIGVWVMRTT
jgi:hypothetical protein